MNTADVKKPLPLARGWTQQQWEQLFTLETLLNEVTMINSGSHCLDRIAKCIALGTELRKWDESGRFPDLVTFLKERAILDPKAVEQQAFAFAACTELIKGDGTAASHQRAIDLARQALGLPVS